MLQGTYIRFCSIFYRRVEFKVLLVKIISYKICPKYVAEFHSDFQNEKENETYKSSNAVSCSNTIQPINLICLFPVMPRLLLDIPSENVASNKTVDENVSYFI